MKRSHVQFIFALVLVAAMFVVVSSADAGQSRRTADDIVNVLGDDSGVAPSQGEPDVGQTNDDPGSSEPGIGDLRWARTGLDGLLSSFVTTGAIWTARLFGIGI